jgi:DNA-binding IclR family transcriptional regulator
MKQSSILDKTFQVLEFLSREPEKLWALSEIADQLSLHRATCVRILKNLVALHYAEQDGLRGGYRLGFMPYHLTRNGPYRRDLVAVAEPYMVRLFKEVDETVMLVTLSHGRRLKLCQLERGGELRIDESAEIEADPYVTATGRLLLAHATESEVEMVLSLNGLPGDKWAQANNRQALMIVLAGLRQQPEPLVMPRSETIAIACTIRRGGVVVAALGLHLPLFRFKGDHKQKVLKQMSHMAAEISAVLGRADLKA